MSKINRESAVLIMLREGQCSGRKGPGKGWSPVAAHSPLRLFGSGFMHKNELISNLIPATGLKIVGTWACLTWCSISSSFQSSLKMSGHRGYEFLEFWFWNLVPFLPDIGFQLLKSLWSSLMYFSFIDVPNVLYRWKIWTAGRSIQQFNSLFYYEVMLL